MRAGLLSALLLLTAGCDTAGFSDAFMALDSSGNRKREHFFTDTESIFCIGKLASGVNDLTVTGTLRAEQLYDLRDGSPRNVNFYLGRDEEAPGAGTDIIVSYEMLHPDPDSPYPAGRFVCELSLDGKVEERVPFEINYPACPDAPIVDGGICAGFVLAGARCAGALDNDCVCESDGTWSCQ
jgi:hypothetical protein